MIRIALVFPYKGFFDIALDTFQEHNRFEKNFGNGNREVYVLDEIVISDKEIPDKKFDCDVIISRGITAQIIKSSVVEIPVVEIPVVGNDLIKILYQCKKLYGRGKKVAVIGSQNMIYGAEGLSEIIDLDIKAYVKKSYIDSEELVEKAVADNCDVIVSGVGTCRIAKSKGREALEIKSGKEAFWQALTEAKRVALINRREKERTQRYKTILNYVNEGVIALDSNGNVTVFNEAAEKLTGLKSKNILNFDYKNVYIPDKLKKIFDGPCRFFNDILSFNNIQMAMNKVPIEFNDEKIGVVITLQDITRIQELEGDIRNKIHNRGHIAKYRFNDISSNDPEFLKIIEKVRQFSHVDSNLLITGRTGTGKELFAQSIHNESKRANGPFVAVNCAAIPEQLLESELFGYVEGAFTGAVKGGKAGLFELAHGGTIFLDEIAEITPPLQCRLLRVLQEREVMRLGDTKVIPVNVRVIAATNKNLIEYVNLSKFREDLYYRLNVLSIRLPDLDERGNDIKLLARQFVERYSSRIYGKKIDISEDAVEYFKRCLWKGNVRELKNICERLVVLINGREIETADVLNVLSGTAPEYCQNNCKDLIPEDGEKLFGSEKDFMKKKILKVLRERNFNRTDSAKALGMSRTTLWRWIKELEI